MLQITPALLIMAKSNLPIEDIIQMMIDEHSSYVLLTNDRDEISGIFTDRDILKKFSIVSNKENLKHGIHTVMNKPVRVLMLNEIHKSAEMMIKHNIRHIPIISHNRESDYNELVGIITADALFKNFAALQPLFNLLPNLKDPTQTHSIGVISPNGSLFCMLKDIFSANPNMNVHRLWYGEMQTEAAIESTIKTCEHIYMDIDDLPLRSWTQILRLFNNHSHIKHTSIFYSVKKQSESVTKTIQELQIAGLIKVYLKPINLGVMLEDLKTAFVEG